jgi:hypothetical protein
MPNNCRGGPLILIVMPGLVPGTHRGNGPEQVPGASPGMTMRGGHVSRLVYC